MRGVNETAVIAGTVAGQSLIVLFVLAPDDQCTYFIQLDFITVITFPFLGRHVIARVNFEFPVCPTRLAAVSIS